MARFSAVTAYTAAALRVSALAANSAEKQVATAVTPFPTASATSRATATAYTETSVPPAPVETFRSAPMAASSPATPSGVGAPISAYDGKCRGRPADLDDELPAASIELQ
ncbi:hypothetical protein [Streptomyces sp. YKOK-I1]